MKHCCSDSPSLKKIYTCPMHPEIQQDHPGICPICGMALEVKDLSLDEDNSEYREMLLRFWIGAILTIPVLLLAMKIPFFNSMKYSHWLQFFFSTPVVLVCGWTFFKRAWYSFVNRSLNMFTLIALGVGAAYLSSVAAVLFPSLFPDSFKENGEVFIYFEAASVITVLVLLGQVLELKAKSQTSNAVRALLSRAAKTGHLIVDGKEQDIPIEKVRVGDLLRVKPGEKIPVDGVIVEGFSFIDESMMTGESFPIEKKAKEPVIGGTINQTGSFIMRAKHVGSETVLSRIVQMVSDAQRSRAPIQKLADQVSGFFVPAVVIIAIATYLIWAFIGPEPRFVFALVNAVAVLIIACPCALGLATPMSMMVGIGKGAEMGILIKNAEGLQALEKVNTVILDKTGTLTEGKPTIVKIIPTSGWQENEILRLAASLEALSEHPIAKALVHAAQERNIPITKVEQFQAITGGGVKGTIEGKSLLLGKIGLMKENQSILSGDLQIEADQLLKNAESVVCLSLDGKAIALISVVDPIKASTPKAVEDLHRLGITVVMLTGDHKNTAVEIAKKIKIDEVYAEVNPADKYRIVQQIKSKGFIVAMAGDGMNDAPALAAADVGIAMGTGADVAIESAAVTLVKGDLTGIVRAMNLSRATMQNIRQNLFFAFIYNALGIPLAAGILYPFTGLLLNPMIASAAMAFSSVSVILNALRLNRKKI